MQRPALNRVGVSDGTAVPASTQTGNDMRVAQSQTSPHPTGALVSIRSLAPSLASAERRVAEAILADPSLILERTISDLAELCQTSATTVVRFCRRANFTGYRELRLALATEVGRDYSRHGEDHRLGADITRDDSMSQVAKKIAYAGVRAIEETIESVDMAILTRVAKAVARASTVNLYGVGASSLAARDLQQKLQRIGRRAELMEDPDHAVSSAVLLSKNDVAIGISNSGETAEIVDWIITARRHQGITVAVTNYQNSRLAQSSEFVLKTAAAEGQFRPGAMASRLAQLTLIDCLFIGVVQGSYDRSMNAVTVTRQAVADRRSRSHG